MIHAIYLFYRQRIERESFVYICVNTVRSYNQFSKEKMNKLKRKQSFNHSYNTRSKKFQRKDNNEQEMYVILFKMIEFVFDSNIEY